MTASGSDPHFKGSFIDDSTGFSEDSWADYKHSTLSATTDPGNHLLVWGRNKISMRSKWIAETLKASVNFNKNRGCETLFLFWKGSCGQPISSLLSENRR